MALWRSDWPVRDTQGNAIPNASVYWCTQPSVTSAVPPSPLVAVALSSTGSPSTANQPQITNGFGQVAAYMNAGVYTVVEVWNGKIQGVYPDQAIGTQQGTIGSVGLTMPAGFTVANSPITTSGTLAVTSAYPALNLNILNYPQNGVAPGQAKGQRLSASMLQGSPTLNIASGDTYSFSPADVGALVNVVGAGTNGANLYATIIAYISATSVTLSLNASTAVSSANVVWWVAGQDAVDRAALNAAIAAATDLQGQVFCPAGFYLYDVTPTWSAKFQALVGQGMRSTFWSASNANAGGFYKIASSVKWTNFGGKNQGFSIWGPGYSAPATVSAYSITSNVGTFTVSNGVTLPVGASVMLQLFQSDNTIVNRGVLNGAFVTVLTSSSTQFTANITGANISVASDIGIASIDVNAFKIGSGLWFGAAEEIETFGFPGSCVQTTQPILDSWKRIYSHNCGGFHFNTTNFVGNHSGPTVEVYEQLYGTNSNGNVGAGAFYGQGLHSTSIRDCGGDTVGFGIVLDSCWATTVIAPHVEQLVYTNASLPGNYLEIRSPRGVKIIEPWCIQDSGGNSAQVYLNVTNGGTQTLIAEAFKLIGGYFDPEGVAPTSLFVFGAGTISCKADDFFASIAFTFSDSGTNNSIIYLGAEKTNGNIRNSWNNNYGTVVVSASTVDSALITVAGVSNSTGQILGVSNQATVATNYQSPKLQLQSTYYTGAVSANDVISVVAIPAAGANPLISYDITHTSGSSGGLQLSVNGNKYISGAGAFVGPSISTPGNAAIGGNAGFNGTSPIAKPTVTGSKGANAALTSLLTALASYGLITDSTS